MALPLSSPTIHRMTEFKGGKHPLNRCPMVQRAGARQKQTDMKILRVRELVLVGFFVFSIWQSFPALADQPTASDWQRVERQVEKLTEGSGADAIALERRLTAIEYQQKDIAGRIEVVTKLGLAIMASVTGLIIQALWGLILKRRQYEKDSPN